MIGTIVVPVDGSAHADRAVDLAGDLAAKYRARIVLVHVLLMGFVPEDLRALAGTPVSAQTAVAAEGLHAAPELPREARIEIGERILAKAVRRAEYHGARQVETAWLEGPVTQRIVEYAEDRRADMIVMGSRGLSDLKGLVIGSVSHKVAHLFEGHVVLVK